MEQLNSLAPGQASGPVGMQRPQPGNGMQQLHAQIMQNLRNTMHQLPPGWQTTYNPQDRANRVMQMVTGLRFLQPDVGKCLNTAINYEIKMISEAPDRQTYVNMFNKKLEDITTKRHNMMMPMNMQNPQMGMPMNPNMAMMQNGLPNNMQNGLGNNMMNGLNNMMGGMQGNGQAFPAQLQRPMQPSLPQQQSTLDPSALLQQSQPLQQQQRPQMNPQMAQGMNQGQPGVQQQPTHEDIIRIAQGLYNRAPEDKKMAMRNSILSNMTPEVREQTKAEGMDPVMKVFYNRAREVVLRGGLQNAAQNGMGMQNQQPDFTSILGQHANGLKSQESGNEVVPASNNGTFNLGAQMNVPQGMNSQMLAVQGNQPGGNAAQMNNQMQFMMQQQERQQRMQRSNILAQQQAQAQSQHANQLRGQPGGLNAPNALTGGPAGQLNSPAMPTLNRPMGPTGQANSNAAQNAQQANQKQPQPGQQAGQQNRPQGTQGNNNQPQNQQQMPNQNNHQMGNNLANPQQHQQLMQFIRTFPLELQQKLSSMPPQHAQAMIARMRSQAQSRGLLNGQQNQGGAPNNPNMQQNGQQQMMGGMQQNNANNNVAGFGAQIPQGQLNQNFDPQKQLQQQQQQAAIRLKAMDFAPFPKQILQQIGVNTTQNITVWGELKRHVQQTQSILPPGTFDRVLQAQRQYFDTHPDELPRAMQALRTRLQQASAQGQQSGALNALQQMNLQNGGAVQMQGMPPNPGMQMPAGGPTGMGQTVPRLPPNLAPTQQEIQVFRERNAQLTQNMTDEHLRSMLTKKRLDALRQTQQQQQLFQQNALRNAQQMQQPQPQRQRPPQQPGPPQMGGQASQQQPRPQVAGNQPMPVQGQKRPQSSHDDVVEIPNPNVAQPSAAAAVPVGQTGQAKQQIFTGLPKGFPTREQLEKMPPQARDAVVAQIRQQQREALRKAQSGLPNNATQGASPYQNMSEQDLRQRISQLFREMVESTKKGPPQQLDAPSSKAVMDILRRLYPPLQRIQETFGHGLRMSDTGEARVKSVMRVKIIVAQNVASLNEANDVVIKDYLSVNVHEAKQLSAVLNGYFNELKAHKEGPAASAQAPGVPATAASATGPAAPAKRPSASAKGQGAPTAQGSSMSKTASQQGHARKASSSKAPPAPTDNKTFDWGAPSAHGIPQYNRHGAELTPDKLKMPATKRAKKGQSDSQTNTPSAQSGTPTATTTSPKLGRTTSSQQLRKTSQQLKDEATQKEAESRKFRCKEILCEGNIAGFETEAELQKHMDSVHQQNIDDPLAFLLANEPTEAKAAPTKDSMANVVANRKILGKERPSSAIKLDRAGTSSPAMSAAVKGGLAPPKAEGLDNFPVAEPSLRDAMTAKLGFELPKQADDEVAVPPMGSEGEDQFIAMLENAAFGESDAVDSLANFTSIDDYWTLRPEQIDSSPTLTPSDGSTSLSSHSSDISQTERLRINLEWDPWGIGDTCVPAGLRDIESLGLGGDMQGGQVADGDTAMADAGDESIKDGAVERKKLDGSDERMWDWNADTHASDWDTLFGANAGLEPLDQDWAKDLFANYG